MSSAHALVARTDLIGQSRGMIMIVSSDYEILLRFMFLNKIKVKYLPGILVHMRAGGYSNRSIWNRIAAHKEDYKAWRSNGITPKWYTIAMKPLRKLW